MGLSTYVYISLQLTGFLTDDDILMMMLTLRPYTCRYTCLYTCLYTGPYFGPYSGPYTCPVYDDDDT